MKSKSPGTRELVVSIICSTLVDIPSLQWMIRRARDKRKAMIAVSEYLYDHMALRQGVFVSSDRNGVLLMYEASGKAPALKSLWLKLNLMIRCVGIRRAIAVLNRNRIIRRHHPGDQNFLHVQYLGVRPGTGTRTVLELKGIVERESLQKNLPVYMETTIEQVRRIYERYGFELYHEFVYKNSGFTTWMMRKDPGVIRRA